MIYIIKTKNMFSNNHVKSCKYNVNIFNKELI